MNHIKIKEFLQEKIPFAHLYYKFQPENVGHAFYFRKLGRKFGECITTLDIDKKQMNGMYRAIMRAYLRAYINKHFARTINKQLKETEFYKFSDALFDVTIDVHKQWFYKCILCREGKEDFLVLDFEEVDKVEKNDL
jgi:hypothetical protein